MQIGFTYGGGRVDSVEIDCTTRLREADLSAWIGFQLRLKWVVRNVTHVATCFDNVFHYQLAAMQWVLPCSYGPDHRRDGRQICLSEGAFGPFSQQFKQRGSTNNDKDKGRQRGAYSATISAYVECFHYRSLGRQMVAECGPLQIMVTTWPPRVTRARGLLSVWGE